MTISEKRTAIYNARIAKVLEAEVTYKSAVKEANEALGYFYDDLRKEFDDATNFEKCWDIPFGLHQVREAKHKEVFGDFWERVEALVELRAQVKAVPVGTFPRKEETVEAKIARTVREEIEANKEKFDVAKRIIELFGKWVFDEKLGKEIAKFPISVNHVYCQNYFGTTWVRIDWYLSGRRTPFNMIMAAAEEFIQKGNQN